MGAWGKKKVIMEREKGEKSDLYDATEAAEWQKNVTTKLNQMAGKEDRKRRTDP